jgi:hypothetical protein
VEVKLKRNPAGRECFEGIMRETICGICFAVAMALLFASPMAHPLTFQGHETASKEIQRMVELDTAVRALNLPIRWAPDFAKGFGSPFFNFYPPLFLYSAELFHLCGTPYAGSIDFACLFFILAAAVGMFLAARDLWGFDGAMLSTAAYVLFPYRIVQLYIRGAYAEFSSGAVLPWIVWAMNAYMVTRRAKYAFLLSVFVALLTISHSVIALFFVPIIFCALIYQFRGISPFKNLIKGMVYLVLGVFISGYYWIPALLEGRYVRLDLMRRGYFDVSQHFVYLHQMLGNLWGFGPSIAGPDDNLPLQIGPIWLIAFAAATIRQWSAPAMDRRIIRFWSVAAIFLMFMNLSVSEFVWRLLPPLTFSQFPWRTYTILALPVAIVTGALFQTMKSNLKQLYRIPSLIVMASLFVYSGRFIKAPNYIDLSGENFSRAAIEANWISTTASGEYEPKWLNQKRLEKDDIKAAIVKGAGVVNIKRESAEHLQLSVSAMSPVEIRLHRAYYPGWKATGDTREIPVDKDSEGRVTISVDQGEHEIDLKFGETAERKAADIISIAAIVLVLGMLFFERRSKNEEIPVDEGYDATYS